MKRPDWPSHPIGFAAFPALALYVVNLRQFPIAPRELLWPVLGSVVGVLAVWAVLGITTRSMRLGAVLASAAAFIWFSYGHVVAVFERMQWPAPVMLGWLVLVGLAAGVGFLAVRWRSRLSTVSRLLDVVSAALIVVVGAQWGLTLRANQTARFVFPTPVQAVTSAQRPDVYYIILDGYGRADILQTRFGYDNRPFLAALQQRGFQVLTRAHSNYNQTALSLGSSLNLAYLDDFARAIGQEVEDWNPLWQTINDNAVFRSARAAGYTTVAIASGFPFTEIPSADRYVQPAEVQTEFENVFLNTTPLPRVQRFLHRPTAVDHYRAALLARLDALPSVAAWSEPTWTFLHILAPHPPFVFDAVGGPVNDDQLLRHGDGTVWVRNDAERAAYRRAYVAQLQFVNTRVLAMIDEVLARSATPPVIILQGDHGPGSGFHTESLRQTDLDERFSILSAVLIPGATAPVLPDDATPVNTFRYIFRSVLGATLPLEIDRSYFSTIAGRYRFTDVTDRLEH